MLVINLILILTVLIPVLTAGIGIVKGLKICGITLLDILYGRVYSSIIVNAYITMGKIRLPTQCSCVRYVYCHTHDRGSIYFVLPLNFFRAAKVTKNLIMVHTKLYLRKAIIFTQIIIVYNV